MAVKDIEIRHGHVFCGLGGGARGMNRGKATLGNLRATFRCVGGIDNDAAAIKDFEGRAGVRGTVLDMFSLDQYQRFHGKMPPAGWREATGEDVRRAFNNERPHIGFMSSPCKGYSGLLSQAKSETSRYQALNELALRGLWLYLEAWKDDPSEFILFENVPRIQTRGRHLLDQIIQLLHAYGYATAETTHDCGELGGLAQSRKRFLLVARHMERVPAFLYEAPRKPLKAVGSVLERFPLPGDATAGPMHRSPALQWKTWVRLAFVEAGSDWRSLKKLNVHDGYLSDYLIVPDMYRGTLGVSGWNEPAATVTGNARPVTGRFAVSDPRAEAFSAGHGVIGWNETSGTVAGDSLPSNGRYSVADPRFDAGKFEGDQLGVRRWDEPAGAITSARAPGQGGFSVADPRIDGHDKSVQMGVRAWDQPAGVVTGKMFAGGGPNSVADPPLPRDGRYANVYKIVRWDEAAPAVTAGGHPSAGGASIADPRVGYGDNSHRNKLKVQPWASPSSTVTGASQVQGGALSVADPRTGFGDSTHHNVLHVTGWDEHSKVVTGANHPSGGALAIADPRPKWNGCAEREHFDGGGHYGVIPWDQHARSVVGSGSYDNGFNSVADPRESSDPSFAHPDSDSGIFRLPTATQRLVCVIRALDGTWHRPFTTLELAALQGLVDPEEHLELEGLSDSAWRERIGNAVPSPAAEAIASVMGRALLGAMAGETFLLSSEPVWVQPVAIAISLARPLYR